MDDDKIMVNLTTYYIIQNIQMLNKLLRFGFSLYPHRLIFRSMALLPPKAKALSLILANFTIFNLFILSTNNHIQMKEKAPTMGNREPAEAQQQHEEQQQQELFKIPEDVKTRINKHKMILVMDLDETMVFTRRKKRPAHLNFREINISQKDIIYVEYRPHIGQFLAAVSQLFTIYVYTAGTKNYADFVLDSLPNHQVITKRFYRDSCIQHRGNLIKDLKVIRKSFGPNYKQKLMILVDDNGLSINYNHPHAIKIRAFVGSQDDRYLTQIFQKLIEYYRQYSHPAPA